MSKAADALLCKENVACPYVVAQGGTPSIHCRAIGLR